MRKSDIVKCLIVLAALAFVFWKWPDEPVKISTEAVKMSKQERAERACQGDTYYDNCVRILMERE